MAKDLVWVENKRTPIVVDHGKGVGTSSHYHPDSDGKEVKRRKATPEEEKTAAKGDWVRVNKDDKKPSDEGYMDRKSKVRPQHNKASILPANAFGLLDMMTNRAPLNAHLSEDYLASVRETYGNTTLAASAEGYDGVTHAGIAIVAAHTGRVLMAQRSLDDDDDPEVQETWEFPGGGLDDGEEPYAGAVREFGEETGLTLREGEVEVVDGWRAGETENYQGFVAVIDYEIDVSDWAPTDEVQKVRWMGPSEVTETIDNGAMRPELVASMDWSIIWGVSGNQEEDMPDSLAASDRPVLDIGVPDDIDAEDMSFADLGPIPVHGIVAPEALESGDGRGFREGSMTSRPLRLPFSWQKVSGSGHTGSVVIGSMDRMMRKDGMIHWEGQLLPDTPEAEEFMGLLAFFGKYGVSVDGDRGAGAEDETTGVLWFDAVRAAGLTAVSIPAFAEAYVAFGPHPDMPSPEVPEEAEEAQALVASGSMVGGQEFRRGPGWVTDPVPTKRIHDYWTKPGEEGYAKINWGVGGDYRRCMALVGAKVAQHSPDKSRFMNRICAEWHHDALGYWPGDLGKPGNNPVLGLSSEAGPDDAAEAEQDIDFDEVTRLLTDRLDRGDIAETEEEGAAWEAVLVSSAAPRPLPPLDYFHQHPAMKADVWGLPSGALTVEEPDENNYRRVWGFAGEWGVCHLGFDNRCVEIPAAGSDDYPDFHLGITRTAEGKISTGVLTYGVGHRDADTILSESATQAHFDNIKNAWASVRVGENERGVWFSGVLLPKVDADDLTKIEASGQVSGEWKGGAMRACLTVNVPGYRVHRASAAYDEQGNVMALAASAFTVNAEINGVAQSECAQATDDPVGDLAKEVWARIDARTQMAVLRQEYSADVFAALKDAYEEGED